MVIATLALLLAAAPGPSGAPGTSTTAAVLVRLSGVATVWTAEASRAVASGDVIKQGDVIDVGGWCELFAPGDVRMRMGAATRARLGASVVDLARGRLWVQVAASPTAHPIEVRAADWRIWVPRGASVVIERSTSSAVEVAVRSGRAEIGVDGWPGHIDLAPGEIARGKHPAIAPGGDALLELASSAAREGNGDVARIHTFLLDRARLLPIGPLDTRTVAEIGRVDAELVGSDHGLLFEEAVRPSPFFLDEVPTKGPNVSVEVEFSE